MDTSRQPPRHEHRVPRRRARGMAVLAAVMTATVAFVAATLVLDQREEQAADRLNAACQDNHSRAYGAALRIQDSSAPEAAALQAARVYVKEVRQTPVCFAANVRSDAEAAEQAIQAGERPRPEDPKGVD